jgi:hypothetical protein
MKLVTPGVHKLKTVGSSSVVKISGDAGGAVLTIGYSDGDGVVPYETASAVEVGKQYTIDHGMNDPLFLVVTGGSSSNINVITGSLT